MATAKPRPAVDVKRHRPILLAAFLAVLPIFLAGPSCGHDFDFHLLSWLEAASQFAHLHYPHWAYTPAWNAGEPRFLFYPPLSWTLGALLGLILPWKLVPAAFTFAALALSGFSARSLCARFAGPNAATLAAVLYLANPYMLFTAYERTAYGELLAAAWMPLLFAAALAPRPRILPIAIPIAMLWLSNAPAGVMGCYALAFLTLVRLVLALKQSRAVAAGLAAKTLAGTALGLALPAFYLLPAALERRQIQPEMAILEGMRIADNTLFHHMPASPDNFAHDAVLHTASLVTLLLLAAIAVLAAVPWMRKTKAADAHLPLPLLLLTLVIALLLTPLTLSIWAKAPELRFLQFPWRLDAMLAVILTLAAALALNRLRRLRTPSPACPIHHGPIVMIGLRSIVPLLPILLAILLTAPAWILFHQPCDDEDSVPARVALFHSAAGTEPTDEYTPAAADNDALRHQDPPYWIVHLNQPKPDSCDQPAPSASLPGQAPRHIALQITVPSLLVLNRRLYPSWQVTVNGVPATSCDRADGLIAINLPPGEDSIDLVEHGTGDQTAGLALTILAVAASVALTRRRPRLV